MGFLNLQLICRNGILRRNFCGGGRRMMSTSMDPSRISPWLMLPPASAAYKFYSIAEEKVVSLNREEPPPPPPPADVKLVGSSHGWLASFNTDNHDIYLWNPISRRHLKLPEIDSLPESSFNQSCRKLVYKLILSCSPASSGSECRALMAFEYGPLALCCPGSCSAKWSTIGDQCYEENDGRSYVRTYEDFVYSSRQKRLFCLTENNDVESWDLTDPDSPTIVWKDSLDNLDEENYFPRSEEEEVEEASTMRYARYLVFAEQSDRLFLITRRILEQVGPDGSYAKSIYFGMDRGGDDSYPHRTFRFDVHEIDREGGILRYMNGSLDGLAMFVGINHSFALSVADLPELKPNCVYFTEAKEFIPYIYLYDRLGMNYGGHDIGIFNYEERNFSWCYYSSDPRSITKIAPAPMWFTPSPH